MLIIFRFIASWIRYLTSGLLIIWRRRVSIHISRSLWGCNELSFQWSLVKICIFMCKYVIVVLSAVSLIYLLFSVLCLSLIHMQWQFSTSDRYVEVNMNSAAIVWPLFNSLQAFWPGLQVSYCIFVHLQSDI